MIDLEERLRRAATLLEEQPTGLAAPEHRAGSAHWAARAAAVVAVAAGIGGVWALARPAGEEPVSGPGRTTPMTSTVSAPPVVLAPSATLPASPDLSATPTTVVGEVTSAWYRLQPDLDVAWHDDTGIDESMLCFRSPSVLPSCISDDVRPLDQGGGRIAVQGGPGQFLIVTVDGDDGEVVTVALDDGSRAEASAERDPLVGWSVARVAVAEGRRPVGMWMSFLPDRGEGPGLFAATTTPRPTAETAALPLDGLDPVAAARTLSVEALFEPAPAEQADLDAAAEILRRECLRTGGANPPNVSGDQHQQAYDAAREQWLARTDALRTDGLAFIHEHGYSGRQVTDPLWLAVDEGSLEAELMIGGCHRAAAGLQLTRATRDAISAAVIAFNNDRLPEALSPTSTHPVYGPVAAAFETCMSAAGYPDHAERAARRLAEFETDDGDPSQAELALAGADVDCRLETGLPRALVEAIGPMVAEFADQHADLIDVTRTERAAALAVARDVLLDHGIPPLTTP